MKTPMKVSTKVQRIVGILSRMLSRMSITFKCVLRENVIFVTFIHRYRKYHISMYFLRKIIFNFSSKRKISYFPGKKYHLSRCHKKAHIQARLFLEMLSFRAIWRKYHISMYFFEKYHFHFSSKNKDHIFGKKKYHLSWSYSSAIFLERPSFQNTWKKKIWIFLQWVFCVNHS